MVFHWLRDLQNELVHNRRLKKPRRHAPHAVVTPAMVQPLEPRVLLSITPVGPEFKVNTFTTSTQATTFSRSIASEDNGNFVVVWSSFNQDFSSWGVYGQRYDANGIAQGGEFRVNTFTLTEQQNPAVAMDADGDFVVA